MGDRVLVDRETRVITPDGREVTTLKRQVVKEEKEPDYIKVYLQMVVGLQALAKGPQATSSAFNLLWELLRRMNYTNKGQIIDINSDIRKEIIQRCGISRASFYSQIKKFIAMGILHSSDPKHFTRLYVNPHIVGRGKWEEVKEIRACVYLNKKGGSLCAQTYSDDDLPDEYLNAIATGGTGKEQGFTWVWDVQGINRTVENFERKEKENKNR